MPVTTADDRRRVQLPGAKKGDVFSVTTEAPGRFILVRMEAQARKESPCLKLKRGKHGMLYLPVKLSREAIARAVREERDSR